MIVNIIYKLLVLKFSTDKIKKDLDIEKINVENLAIDKIDNQYYAYINNIFTTQDYSLEGVIEKLINNCPTRYFVVNTTKSELSIEDKIRLVSVIKTHLATST